MATAFGLNLGMPAYHGAGVGGGSIPPISFDSGNPIPTPPDLTEGVAITPINVAAYFSGGPPPKVYSIFSGTLPPGLSLHAGTGVVSGTPTTPQGAGNVVFRGTDNAGNNANSNGVPFTVLAAAPVAASRAFATGNTSTVTATIPAGSVGDILVCYTVFASTSNAPWLFNVGWNAHFVRAFQNSEIMTVHSKIAVGGDTFSYQAPGAGGWATLVERYPAGSYNVISQLLENNFASGTSFDPLALTAEASGNYLWKALCGPSAAGVVPQQITGFPSGYTNTGQAAVGASGDANIAVCDLASSTLTQDPGVFTIAVSQKSKTMTAAIRKIASSGAAPTFVSTSTGVTSFGAPTANMPAGAAVGDILLAVAYCASSDTPVIDTAVSGNNWKILPLKQVISSTSMHLIYKVAEASNALKYTSGGWTACIVHAIRGASVQRMSAIEFASNGGALTQVCNATTPISGSRDYLVLALDILQLANINMSAYPAGYSNTSASPVQVNTGAIFSAWKTAVASTFAAATFTAASGTPEHFTAHLLFWGGLTFSGTITVPSLMQNTAITSIDISTNFVGGILPITYSVFSGTLPPGLTLNSSTGVISGTPTTLQAAANVVFKGTDSAGNNVSSSAVSFTVVAAGTPSAIAGNTAWWGIDQPSSRTWNSTRTVAVTADAGLAHWFEPPPDAAANRAVIFESSVNGAGLLQVAEVNGQNAFQFRFISTSVLAAYRWFRKSDNANLGPVLSTDLFTVSGKTIVMALSIQQAVGTTPNPYGAAPILGDDANRFQIGCVPVDATTVKVQPYNYDGTEDFCQLTVPRNQWMILSVRHDGVTLQVRYNRGAWTSVASGPTNTMTGSTFVGQGGGRYTDFMVADQAFFNVALSDANLGSVEDYFASLIGITLPAFDPLYSDTILLMTAQAGNVDSSPLARSLTASGTPVINTTFPRNALPTYNNSASAWRWDVVTPTYVDALLLNGEFCLEMWLWMTAYSQTGFPETMGWSGFAFSITDVGLASLSCGLLDGSVQTSQVGTPALGAWNHFCLMRDKTTASVDTLRYCLNGVQANSRTVSKAGNYASSAGPRLMGYHTGGQSGRFACAGLRLTKNSRRYLTVPFTPDNTPFLAV